MNINEIFGPTIQGEGKYTGYPSVFVRLNGCNLRCCFGEEYGGKCVSMCDTPYTSHHPEQSRQASAKEVAYKIMELIESIGGHPDNSHIVITGGEPMLQQTELIDLIGALQDLDCWNHITIETNGTITPTNALLRVEDLMWSVSPKLSTSCCFEGTDVSEQLRKKHCNSRINLDALGTIVMSDQDYQLKFVYSGPESVKEIETLIEQIKTDLKINCPSGAIRNLVDEKCDKIDSHVLLMPEGTTVEQLELTSQDAVEACIKNGWRFSDRAHIRIWGDKRAV